MGKKHSNSWAIVVLACTVLLLFVPNYAQYQLSPVAHLVMPALRAVFHAVLRRHDSGHPAQPGCWVAQ